MPTGNPEDIMEKTGKHNKVFVSSSEIFQNTECLFIEYDDVLKSPMFSVLNILRKNEKFKYFFDISEIEDADADKLYEWYIERDHKNFFYDFDLNEGILEKDFNNDEKAYASWCDSFYKELYSSVSAETVDNLNWLNFDAHLRKLIENTKDGHLVKNIIIWSPFYVKYIEEEISTRYGGRAKYVYGDLVDVLGKNEIKSDSTFVFSNILHVIDLVTAKLINYSSIIIADQYFYNYNYDMEPVINIDELLQYFIFKIDFFNNIYSLDD